jgi:hypothetical protein
MPQTITVLLDTSTETGLDTLTASISPTAPFAIPPEKLSRMLFLHVKSVKPLPQGAAPS